MDNKLFKRVTNTFLIAESLEMGSQIPYIQRARADGYAVVVLNTNQNSQKTTDGREQPIRHSSSPSTHAQYVWEKFITGCPAQCIAIVAHSAGGYVTLKLAEFFPTEFCQRVFAVALTDSPIRISGKLEVSVRRHLVKVAKNWRCSGEALGTSLDRDFASNEISSISAGNFFFRSKLCRLFLVW